MYLYLSIQKFKFLFISGKRKNIAVQALLDTTRDFRENIVSRAFIGDDDIVGFLIWAIDFLFAPETCDLCLDGAKSDTRRAVDKYLSSLA